MSKSRPISGPGILFSNSGNGNSHRSSENSTITGGKSPQRDLQATKVVFEPPAEFDRELFLTKLWEQDEELVRAGFPAISPWFKEQISAFIRSGKRRWVGRVGRRGGKSSTFCRVLVCWALHGQECGAWYVAKGDRPVISIVSVDNGEAGSRLYTIHQILDALGREHLYHNVQNKHEIKIHRPEVFFWVVTCNVRGTVGHTSILLYCDEMSKWRSISSSANPAKEVMASLRPTMATIKHGLEICVSAPWLDGDYHATMFEAGDDAHQMVAEAATWVANPTLTEEDTHALEPDGKEWRRAYAAIPAGGGKDNWFGGMQSKGLREEEFPKLKPGVVPIVALHPKINDKLGWAVVTSEEDPDRNNRMLVRVQDSGTWNVSELSAAAIVDRIVELCREWYPRKTDEELPDHFRALATQYEGDDFDRICREKKVFFEVVPMAQTSKDGVLDKTSQGLLARCKSVRSAFKDERLQFRSVSLLKAFGRMVESKQQKGVDYGEEEDAHELLAAILGISTALERPVMRAHVEEKRIDPRDPVEIKKRYLREAGAKWRRRWDTNKRKVMREIVFR